MVNGNDIRYTDVTRAIGIDIEKPEIPYGDLSIDSIVDEMFSIQMPYYPTDQPYKVYCKNYLFDQNGHRKDFDTTYIVCIRKPNGEEVDVGKAFAYTCRKWYEITIEEYNSRIHSR